LQKAPPNPRENLYTEKTNTVCALFQRTDGICYIVQKFLGGLGGFFQKSPHRISPYPIVYVVPSLVSFRVTPISVRVARISSARA